MNREEIQNTAKRIMQSKKKMNILLVILKLDYKMADWNCPPIGIAYVSAALKKGGFHVFTANLTELGDDEEIIRRLVVENEIDVVATGILTSQREIEKAKRLFRVARNVKKDIITYIGGGFPTCSPYEALICTEADIGMIGEGEITACEMMTALESGGDLREVKGLCFQDNTEGFLITEPRPWIEDLDLLPWPDWDGFHFFPETESKVGKIVSACIVTSRGCPFGCTFCSKPFGRRYRTRSLDNVFREIEHLVHRYGISRLFFDDDLFAEQTERVKEFCHRIKPYGIRWLVYLRVGDKMTKELLALMHESGCEEINYGIESGDDTVLKSMKKGISTAEIAKTVRLTAEAGIRVRGSFIFGDTAETMQTVLNTFAFAQSLQDSFTDLYYNPIKLFPGSELYKKAIAERRIEDTVAFIENDIPAMNVSKLSDEEYDYLVNTLIPEKSIEYMKHQSLKREKIILRKWEGHDLCGEVKCEYCGEKQQVLFERQNLPFYTAHMCNKCGRRNDILTMKAYADFVDGTLLELMAKRNVALWGYGMWLRYFGSFSRAAQEGSYTLIDGDSKLQGNVVWGKIICAPADIRNRNIDCVVVTAPGAYEKIRNIIMDEYHNVKDIYCIDKLNADR